MVLYNGIKTSRSNAGFEVWDGGGRIGWWGGDITGVKYWSVVSEVNDLVPGVLRNDDLG